MTVVCALTGEMLIEIHHTDSKTVAAVYKRVDQALNGAFVFRLIDGDMDIADMPIAEIKGPLKLIKLRRKGVRSGLHGILREMGTMPGSQNANCFVSDLSDDPDMLCAESAWKYYQRLFGTKRLTEGFIVQARMMELHSMLTTCIDLPTKEIVLDRLRGVTRPSAIDKLLQLHNDGVITLSRQRFYPLARDLGVWMR